MRQRTELGLGNGVISTYRQHHPVLAQALEEKFLQDRNTRNPNRSREGWGAFPLYSLSQSPPELRP